MAATFSVALLTASPWGQGADPGGAFVKVDGRECLLRSVEMFLNRDSIKQIQLVVPPDAMEESKRKFGGHLGFSGVKLLPGGPAWHDQLAAAAEKISAESTHVLIHDAARPAVAYADIDAILSEAEQHAKIALVANSRNGLIEVDPSGMPLEFRAAHAFMQVLTPWSLRKDKFLELARSKSEPSAADFMLLKGSPLNIRVNSSADATLAKAMLALLPRPKIRPADNPFQEAQW